MGLMEAQPGSQLGAVEEWRFREAVNRMVMTDLQLHPNLVPQIALQVACSGEWLPDPRTAYRIVCISGVCRQWMEPRIREQQQFLRSQLLWLMHERILAQARRQQGP